jgi:cobalt/nickel transport protein
MSEINAANHEVNSPKFLDGFTKTMLTVMCVILFFIFISGNYMSQHSMSGLGTDDHVNDLATSVVHKQHHPFVELPGDAEVGAFSIANFFAGIIVGYHWLKIFGTKPGATPKDPAVKDKKEE